MVSASPRKREPTIHEVARVAGVSHGTVSRVLNGARHVSPTAQRAVEDAIDATGYIPNRQARRLVTRQTGSVVAVITESRTPFPGESGSLQILRGCVRALARHEMSVEVVFTGTEEGKARRRQLDRHIAGRRVQGVLLIPHRFDVLPDWLVGQGAFPTVLYGRPEGVSRRVARVMTDDLEGAHAVASHLHASGRRRITALSGPSDSPAGRDRLEVRVSHRLQHRFAPRQHPRLVICPARRHHAVGREKLWKPARPRHPHGESFTTLCPREA
ncbi:hypothetical protein GCM10010446_60050 [Streptomyces enissocaesilis]|uniref:LacI family transcriptional regulator n=1 Tax=Streptomyces enissocaesilis TaxID=332589 RepID=A0ABP6K6E1_9ACTN